MPLQTQRRPFFSIARIIGMGLFLVLGALGRWLFLPEPEVAVGRGSVGPGRIQDASESVSGGRKVGAPAATVKVRPSLADVLDSPPWRRISMVAAFLDGADALETAALTQAIEQQIIQYGPEFPLRREQITLCYARWARLDPRGMMECANRSTVSRLIDVPVADLAFQFWAESDWKAAYEGADACGMRRAKWTALVVYGRTEPEKALQMALAAGIPAYQIGQLEGVFHQLITTDPVRAVDLAMEMTRGKRDEYSGTLLHSVIGKFARADPAGALSYLGKMKVQDLALHGAGIGEAAQTLARTDPARLAEIRDTLEPGALRDTLDWCLIAAKAVQDLDGAISEAQSMAYPAQRDALLLRIAKEVQRADPARALAMINEHPGADREGRTVREIVAGFARADFAAGVKAAGSIQDEKLRGVAMNVLGDMWVEQHPGGSWADATLAIPNATTEPGFVARVVAGVAEKDPAAALEMAQALPGEAGQKATLDLLKAMAHSDASFVWANFSAIPQGEEREEIIRAALRMPFDPVTGMKSVEAVQQRFSSLPEGDRTPSAFGAVTETLYSCDPLAASEFVRDLPAGNHRDSAAAALVGSLISHRDHDYAAALVWSGSIADEKQRAGALRNVGSEWVREDPAAFQAAVNAAPLSAADKADLSSAFLLNLQPPPPP